MADTRTADESLVERIAAAESLTLPEDPKPRRSALGAPQPSYHAPNEVPERASEYDGAAERARSGTAVFELHLAQLSQLGYVTPAAPRAAIAEEMRLMKQSLQARLHGLARPRTILVTSPDRGLGKSFFALNLALSLAIDERAEVALIEADPWPRRPGPLGLPVAPGLTDLLLHGRADPPAAWRRAAQLPLSVLPFGAPVDAPATLFGGEAMVELLLGTGRRAEWIVIDGPPLRRAAGAAALAGRVRHSILVTASERTTKRAVREALERLGGGDRASLVLNDAPSGPAADWPPPLQ